MSHDPTYLPGDSTTESTDCETAALYFQDDGRPVPVELPQHETVDTLEDCLFAHGIIPNEELVRDLARFTDEIGSKKAAAMIRHTFSKLEGTAAAVALRWVVLGTGEQNMRDQAASIGVTHQAIIKAAKLIRKKLGYQGPHR